jgi:hypothetical protein
MRISRLNPSELSSSALTRILSLFLLISVNGCYDDPNLLGPNHIILFRISPTYDIALDNFSQTEINEVCVYWKKNQNGQILITPVSGTLAPERDKGLPGGSSGLLNVAPHRMPKSVDVHWQTPDGSPHSQEVELKIPQDDRCNFYGDVWLIYIHGHWDEQALTFDQERYRAGHTQPYFDMDALQ